MCILEPGRRIYGVALPSESDESDLDEEVRKESGSYEKTRDHGIIVCLFIQFYLKQEDEYLVSTFDINEFQFEIKEDLFGLGYKRLNVDSLFGQDSQSANGSKEIATSMANLLFPTLADSGKKTSKTIAGSVSDLSSSTHESQTIFMNRLFLFLRHLA